jgi:hypothetical protein
MKFRECPITCLEFCSRETASLAEALPARALLTSNKESQ